MQLTEFSVSGFRSLYEARIEPGQFTVLVGANNAGKSNLADAFDFLGVTYRHGLEFAVSRKGGFENIAHRRMRRTKKAITFSVSVELPLEAVLRPKTLIAALARALELPSSALGGFKISHRFSIRAASQRIKADFAVEEECFSLYLLLPAGEMLIAQMERGPGSDARKYTSKPESLRGKGGTVAHNAWDRILRGFGDEWTAMFEESIGTVDLLTSGLRLMNPVVRAFEDSLGGVRLYQVTPLECRKAGAPTPNADLDLHGGNLPALVEYMQKRHDSVWARILDAMRIIVPDLVDIRTSFTHDRRLTLEFVERGVGRPWTVEEISDGTIQSLALFTAIYDPRTVLAFIEEPENAVHPWVVRALVDACRSVPNKQIIITTHSPVLIGYLSPAEVFVVWRANGRTNLAPMNQLDPEAQEQWASGQVSTFDLVDTGWIRESVPESFK